MNKFIFSLLAFFSCFSLSAQVYIDAESEVYGTWKLSRSPYIIQGVVYVPEGKTLTIEPGVVVRFQTGDAEDYSESDFPLGMLRVFGTIVAKGTIKDPIVFTHLEDDEEDDQWGAVHVCSSQSNSVFSYCKFEYARGVVNIPVEDSDNNINATGAVSFYNCGGLVENCLIRYSWAGVNAKGKSKVKVRFCNILDNKYGLESNTGAKITVSSCILDDNETGFFLNEDNAISLSYCFVESGSWHDRLKDGGNNIKDEDDAMFKNKDENDFRLSKKSPCNKKGEGGKNIGMY